MPENNDITLHTVRQYLKKGDRKVTLIGEICLQSEHGTMVRIPEVAPMLLELKSVTELDEAMDEARILTLATAGKELFTVSAELRIWCAKPARFMTVAPIRTIVADSAEHPEGCKCKEALAAAAEAPPMPDPIKDLFEAAAAFLVGK